MNKIDTLVICAAIVMVFSLLFYLDHNEKRMVDVESRDYKIQKETCEIHNYVNADMTAGEMLLILREVDNLVTHVAQN